MFGVSGDLAVRPIASLSGGQKSRLSFAIMAVRSHPQCDHSKSQAGSEGVGLSVLGKLQFWAREVTYFSQHHLRKMPACVCVCISPF